MAVARVAVLAVLAAALFLAVPSGVGAQDVTITEFKTLDKQSPPPPKKESPPPPKKESPPPPRRSSPPPKKESPPPPKRESPPPPRRSSPPPPRKAEEASPPPRRVASPPPRRVASPPPRRESPPPPQKENKASPPPRRQVSPPPRRSPSRRSPPPPIKKYDAYSYKKKYVYIASTEKYSYEDAYNFCYSNGYGMVPYNDKILMGPSSELCFNSEKGCWVGGKQGNYCAFVDPKGNGGAYANDCKERHYVICYGLLKGGK